MKSVLKRQTTIGIALVLVILTAIGSFAGAFAVFHVNTTPSSIYQVDATSSRFNVTSVAITPQGFSQITVSVSVKNLDTSVAHSTNVTVSLFGTSQNLLAQESVLTGSVAALGTTTEVFFFDQQNILLNYSSCLISLSDVS